MAMEKSVESDKSRCGEKRKAPKSEKMTAKEKIQKKLWGTDGPPPPDWIEVILSGRHF
jgi:hypothetical protein